LPRSCRAVADSVQPRKTIRSFSRSQVFSKCSPRYCNLLGEDLVHLRWCVLASVGLGVELQAGMHDGHRAANEDPVGILPPKRPKASIPPGAGGPPPLSPPPALAAHIRNAV